jgi:conjugative transposon TraM protein
MQTQSHSGPFMANRKFYTFLPVLVLPFLTLFYWAIGIKMIYKNQAAAAAPQGLNTSLPDPNLKDETAFTKLGYYKKSEQDSAKIIEQIKKDPYRNGEIAAKNSARSQMSMQGLGAPVTGQKKQVSYKGKTYTGAQQTRIFSKLKTLDSVLTSSSDPKFDKDIAKPAQPASPVSPDGVDMQRLEALMEGMPGEGQVDAQDPEMKELNEMLEKILDIQHPERVAEKLRSQKTDSETLVYAVNPADDKASITVLDRAGPDSLDVNAVSQITFEANGFFPLDDQVTAPSGNAIKAVVHENQTLVTGANIKLRLTADIYVAGTLIPKDNFIYGTVSVNGERLLVEIESIRLSSSLFPVKLSVYDLDGMEGIYIPGAISRDVAKQSLSQDIQRLSLGSLDPSLGAQAAGAGIQAAKTFMGKKTRLIQVSVKAGYQILLKDGNAKAI